MLIDLAFFGPGLILPLLDMSLRRVLFVMILVTLGFRRLLSARPFASDEVAFVTLLLAFGIIWGVLLPLSYGYLLSQSFADISPWLGLITLALWPWDAWPSEAQWDRFCKFVIAISILLAAVHVGIWALLVSQVVSPDAFTLTANLVSTGGDGESFLRLVPLENGQFRVFWSSSVFLLGGVYFLSASRKARNGKVWFAELAFICFALGTTYIRAFLGALLIFVIIAVVYSRFYKNGPQRWPIGTILAFWLASIISVSIAINPVFLDSIGLARDASDVERVQQSTALLAQFAAHPLMGSGFGSYVTKLVRGVDAPFSYELFFYALLMKLGILGVCALVLILGLGLRVALAHKLAVRRPKKFSIWLAFTTGLWFAGATNPMVTNFVGMTIVMLLLVDMRVRSSGAGELGTAVLGQ